MKNQIQPTLLQGTECSQKLTIEFIIIRLYLKITSRDKQTLFRKKVGETFSNGSLLKKLETLTNHGL